MLHAVKERLGIRSWYKFYKDRMNQQYYDHVRNHYKPFFDFLASSYRSNNFHIMADMGCGPAFSSKVLSQEYGVRNIFAFDKDEDVLRLAKNNISGCEGIKAFKLDILDPYILLPFDIIFSHGLLEHFNNHDIQKCLDFQRAHAKFVVHYVPSYKYRVPSYGDERLLNLDQWHKIAKPDYTVEFNDGFDYILVWGGDHLGSNASL